MARLFALSLVAACSVYVGEERNLPKTQTITVKARGLYDSGNNPWTLPDGALLEAMNVEIGRDNSIIPRRATAPVTAAGGGFDFLFRYGTRILAYSSSTDHLYRTQDLGTTWIAGSYTITPIWNTMFSVEAVKSLFIASSSGIVALDEIAGTPRLAGVCPALDVYAILAGAGTAVPNNSRVAYRYLFGRKDANGRILLGTPSSRAVLTNGAGSVQDVTLVATVPAEVADGSHFIQVYRTSSSVDQNTDPGDECYLVYEASLGSGGVLTTVSITDSTPNGLGGASLYTNPSQDTILGGNERPPLAQDLTLFGGSVWYANFTQAARGTINLLGVSGGNGLALNDTITINSQVFTAKSVENIGAKEFLLFTGLPTPDMNIRSTVASLIRVINRTAAAACYATDTSEPSPSGIPGSISLQRTDKTNALTVNVSRASAWSPSTGLGINPILLENGLIYSKTDQPDAVSTALSLSPILVGSALHPIYRIIPTRNSLWVLKTDGIWRVTGSAGQFDVQSFDPTTSIVAPRSAVAEDNKVFFWSDQGIAVVSETGVELISKPIDSLLRSYRGNAFQGSFAAARETNHQYVLWTQYGEPSALNQGPVAFVYDTNTQTWTQRDDSYPFSPTQTVYPTDALVDSATNRLMLSYGADPARLERANQELSNDPIFGGVPTTVSLTGPEVSIGGGSYTIPIAAPVTVTAGDLLVSAGFLSLLPATATVSVSGTVSFLTVRDLSGPFGSEAATIYASYPMTVTYAVKSSTPGTTAEWQEAALLFGNIDGDTATVTLTGDSGSDPPFTIDKTQNPGEARQIRIWPGRTSSMSGIMKLSYTEQVGYATRPTELSGVAWTVLPGGDGLSR